MITVRPSTSEEEILSFVQGEGVRRLVSRGVENPSDPKDVASRPDNHFIIVEDGGDKAGLIAFMKIDEGSYGIHVILRTIGVKTLTSIERAIEWAFNELKAKKILAIYPKENIAIRMLAATLGFSEDEDAKARYRIDGATEPFIYQSLTR